MSEFQEQKAVCQFLDWNHIKYFAVPNGGSRHIAEATRLKASGVKRGAPDMVVFLPNGKTLALEMKTQKGGKISPEQKEWGEFLSNRPEWLHFIAKGAKEAIEYVKTYIFNYPTI